MPTTRDRMDALSYEITQIIQAADEQNRDINITEQKAVMAKTAQLAGLRVTHNANQMSRAATPSSAFMMDGADEVRPAGQSGTRSFSSSGFDQPVVKSAYNTTAGDLAPLGLSMASLKTLHEAVTKRGVATVSTKAPLGTTQVPQAGSLQHNDEVWTGLREMTRVLDLIPAAEATGSIVETFKATTLATGATTVAPGALKPESVPVWQAVQSAVRKIAHWTSVHDEVVADFADFLNLIATEMIAGLIQTENAQVLVGDGLGTNLTGLVTAANAAGSTVGSLGTDLDAVVEAMTRIRTTAFVDPDVIVLNPRDWGSAGFALAKDSTGAYLLGDAVAAPKPMLWGMRVVLTTTMTENTALVGNFARAAQAWIRQGPTFDVAPSSGAEFKSNVTLFRAEERIALEVVRPEALCAITAV